VIGQISFNFQVQPFVILFVERSGSTYLATLLDCHPQIIALREKFADLRQEGKTPAEQMAWADAFLKPPLVGRARACGFKTKLIDIPDRGAFADLLRRRRCKIICLQRRNVVKGVISTINAKRLWEVTGAWNLLDEAKRMPAFVVDPMKFGELLVQREQWDREIEEYARQLALPTLWLKYEDLLCDEPAMVAEIFAFLGVRPMTLHGRTHKHTSDNLREAIRNFDALRAPYAGTRYETMFDEVLVPAPA
jgi:LPS sulfotransferase NodH